MRVADHPRLRQLLDERIVVLDGAWGVLIHQRKLTEEEYRGKRFATHSRDVKGDPDLLNLTTGDRRRDPRFVLRSGRRHRDHQHVHRDGDRAGRLCLEAHAAEMSLEGARIARRAADEWTAPGSGAAPLRGGCDRAPERLALRLAEGRGRRLPLRHLRAGSGDLRRADPGPCRRWGGHPPDRDNLRQLNAKAAIVAAREVAPESRLSGSRSPRSTRAVATSPGRPRRPSGSRSSTQSHWSSGSTARSAPPK